MTTEDECADLRRLLQEAVAKAESKFCEGCQEHRQRIAEGLDRERNLRNELGLSEERVQVLLEELAQLRAESNNKDTGRDRA